MKKQAGKAVKRTRRPTRKRTSYIPVKTRKTRVVINKETELYIRIKEKFLGRLKNCATAQEAAKGLPVARETLYAWRNDDSAFRKAWDDADMEGGEALIQEAIRRGKDGTLKPVYYKGSAVGAIREYSDLLLMFLIKQKFPSFRESFRPPGTVGTMGDDGEEPQVGELPDPQEALRRLRVAATRIQRMIDVIERGTRPGQGGKEDEAQKPRQLADRDPN